MHGDVSKSIPQPDKVLKEDAAKTSKSTIGTLPSEADAIIVGAGPAGLFAALELGKMELKVVLIDKGPDVSRRLCPRISTGRCIKCKVCAIMCGVGGAGTFSDGTLNLRPDIGGDLGAQIGDHEKAWELVNEVDRIFLQFGAPPDLKPLDPEKIAQLKMKAASVGARFIDIPQRHIGTDRAPVVIQRFADELRKLGVFILTEFEVKDLIIEGGVCKGVVVSSEKGYAKSLESSVPEKIPLNQTAEQNYKKNTPKDGEYTIYAKYTILAPGRVGASWVDALVEKHRIKARFAGIDVGVRVEVPAIVMDPVTSINRDPKFHFITQGYDDFVRTFCTNDKGYVVMEDYNGYVCTNGHSFSNKDSSNTNFAFLVHIELTEPLENTTRYAISCAKLATTIGGGRPIVQRLGDLRRGRRSTQDRLLRNPVQPTLKDATPGDISMALPHRIVVDILEGLDKFNEIVPGVASASTLLYAPEVKFYSMQLIVDKQFETSVKNLYAAGDGTGQSRDIVNAAATGLVAARGILAKLRS